MERNQAILSSRIERQKDYYFEQLLEYFDGDIFYLIHNSKKVRHTDSKYSFVIIKNQEEKPLELRIGTVINSEYHDIIYKYDDNTISIKYKANTEERFYNNINKMPDVLKIFVRTLFRYIKKGRQRDYPSIINE